jgi:hypothetical protein
MSLQLNRQLNDQQIIRLHRDLLAPVVVHEIMTGKDALDETALYTLDVMIAEYKPDTALLCIALCAAHIAEKFSASMPIAGSLGFEASRIAHAFGPAWIANSDSRLNDSHEMKIIDLLEQMPEDFEALADLMDALRTHLPDQSEGSMLCDMLSQSARSFIDYLESQEKEPLPTTHLDLEVHGNIITFPRLFRPH